jgi:uncharacterized NAD-dependent epimerase/dehydratase family protein
LLLAKLPCTLHEPPHSPHPRYGATSPHGGEVKRNAILLQHAPIRTYRRIHNGAGTAHLSPLGRGRAKRG